jgi:hypothetical protein
MMIQKLIDEIEEKDIMNECKTAGSYNKLYEMSEVQLLELMAAKTSDPHLVGIIAEQIIDLPAVAAKTTFI